MSTTVAGILKYEFSFHFFKFCSYAFCTDLVSFWAHFYTSKAKARITHKAAKPESFELKCLFLGHRSVKTVFPELILLRQVMAHNKIQHLTLSSTEIRKVIPNLVKEDLPVFPCIAVCHFLEVRLGRWGLFFNFFPVHQFTSRFLHQSELKTWANIGWCLAIRRRLNGQMFLSLCSTRGPDQHCLGPCEGGEWRFGWIGELGQQCVKVRCQSGCSWWRWWYNSGTRDRKNNTMLLFGNQAKYFYT